MRTDTTHLVERRVRRALVEQPELAISNLVVHRLRDGVCLTGIVQSQGKIDPADVARKVEGAGQVLDRLVRPTA